MLNYTITTEKTWSRILGDLDETFRKWMVGVWNVACTLPPPRTARQSQTLAERRVQVTWRRGKRDYTLTMDRQSRAVDNLLVLQLAIEALRLNEKRGIAETLAEAYRQEFPALPAPGQTSATRPAGPYAVLHLQSDAPIEVCEAAYRALAKQAHPDAGGSHARMAALAEAIETIRKERA